MLKVYRRFRLATLLFFLGCSLFLRVQAADSTILIVSAGRNAAFSEAAKAFTDDLERTGVSRSSIQYLTTEEFRSSGIRATQLVLALGVEASIEMSQSDMRTPVLCAFVPSSSFEQIARSSHRKTPTQLSAVYLNQPLGRQLDLIQLALPQRERIGVLLGSHSITQMPHLETERRKRSLSLLQSQIEGNEPIFSKLQTLLEASEVLLAIPDPQVYHSGSLQNILLSALRAGVPMVSFSPAYVKAGALIAIYSTPSQVGVQTAQMARLTLQGKELSAPQYPHDFWIDVNLSLARSMSLDLEAQKLTERLKRLEATK